MRRMLRVEWRKAWCNPLFFITLLLAVGIAVWAGVDVIQMYRYDQQMMAVDVGIVRNPEQSLITLFNSWIGQNHVVLGVTVFYTLLPILAVLPYGWSYFSERQSGYTRLCVTRTRRYCYFLSKYVAAFSVGALVALIPLVINLLLVSSFVPAAPPDIRYNIYYGGGLLWGTMGSTLFYDFPYLFILMRLGLGAVFAGLIATCPVALSFFVKNRFAVLLIPFIALLILHYFSGAFSMQFGGLEFSLMQLLHGGSVMFPKWSVAGVYAAALFAFSFGITMWKGVRSDVF